MNASLNAKLIVAACAFMVSSVALAGDSDSDGDKNCPAHRQQRTAEQVLADHIAAILSENAALVSCDYADDAVVIMSGNVISGPKAIAGLFAYLFQLTGGDVSITPHAVTSSGQTTLVEYGLDSDHLSVADGADTFVIKDGMIVVQTVHLGGLAPK